MSDEVVRYPGYRLPPAIISQAVWLPYRSTLGFRDVEGLLAERGITVDDVAVLAAHLSFILT